MPSRKEIQWSELRVGALVLTATGVLIGLIFLMSGSTGGFARKATLRVYFDNASGLKNGAPVTLEGVTIGNIQHVRVVPSHKPRSVEVTMKIGHEFLRGIHTDSTATIAQAGVLGDSFIDIESTHATGPEPANDAELQPSGSPSLQDVIRTSQVSIEEINQLTRKIETLVDTLNSKRGTAGELINDPALGKKITQIATNLQTITAAISDGKGSIGKFVNDDTFYTRANSTIDQLNQMVSEINQGQGSAGKFLKDDTLYKNLNETVTRTNHLLAEIDSGKGAANKLIKDPEFANKLDDTLNQLDTILKGVNEGKGSLGQLAQNRELYDHYNAAGANAAELLKDMRNDPKKYLIIRLKLF